MEYFERISDHIRAERKIKREDKEEKGKIKAIEKYFHTAEGKKHLEDNLKKFNIKESDFRREKEILAVDNNEKDFRLVTNIYKDKFVDILRSLKPKSVKYKIDHQTDTQYSGPILLEIDDKLAFQTYGIIMPQVDGIKSIFGEVPEVNQIRWVDPKDKISDGDWFSYYWQEAFLKYKDSKE